MLNAALKPLSYMIPLLIVMSPLSKRRLYPLRVLACLALFCFCFEGLLAIQPDISQAWGSPAVLLAYMLIYVAVLGLMAAVVLACCDVPFTYAFFCAGAAYTAQNLSFIMRIIIGNTLLSSASSPAGSGAPDILSWATMTLTALVFYALFVRPLGHEGIEVVSDRSALIAISAAIFFNIALNTACSSLIGHDLLPAQLLVFQASQAGLCIIILYMEYELLVNRRLKIEAAATDQLIRDRERQYETSRDTIDAINIKMHDIRHQIRHLEDGSAGTTVLDREVLREIASGVNVYDSAVKTGNDALDTILTEKSLLCDSLGIEFTCTADGSQLSFLSPAELYSLFGNMLDNAIEATRNLEDPAKKVITLGVRSHAGLVTIHEENYFSGTLRFADRVPQSTKNDPLNHGFGFRSMQMIVEGKGGALDCKTTGDVFSLDIALPLDAA